MRITEGKENGSERKEYHNLRAWLRQAVTEHDVIVEVQCRYQAQLEEYRSFSRCMRLEEQMERVYTGGTPGRISPSPQGFARRQTEQINKEKERQEKIAGAKTWRRRRRRQRMC